MAIVFNKGQRGFVLKSGILEAGKHIELEDSQAEKLAGMYPAEIEIIKAQPVQAKAPVAEIPVPEVKQEEKAPVKAKKGSKK